MKKRELAVSKSTNRNVMSEIVKETNSEPIRVERSGMARLRWRKLDVPVLESKIIIGGVELLKN